ncbi:hypothetical protein LVY72_02340 [Arthrobacter sp. I2-34]|uniref:Uncharacterized protein n=1 Tax=Arthrobacter hankyongi TaxID=2904801 RepID=A0ABS9L273_9MICC|nr:hypothetical protein [Arthrobacter hankyongi]MCG2620747.1 hypothetical protein [Arthrobacter hankyongi]
MVTGAGVRRGLDGGGQDDLERFRDVCHGCLTRRPDKQFELCDAVLGTDGPAAAPVSLWLGGGHRCG